MRVPFCFNQIAGGNSSPCTLAELRAAGVRLAIYSTPCLFAAQEAIEKSLLHLSEVDGSLADSSLDVGDFTALLNENLSRRSVPEVVFRSA